MRPPPVVVSGITDFSQLNNLIKQKTKSEYSMKIINKNIYKINAHDSNDYREITKALNDEKIAWHTYEDKQNRPIRVIAKNLHNSCEPNDIISDLKRQGFQILNAFNKKKFKTKEPLDMFVLSFASSENPKNIYEIKKILNTIVYIEPFKLSKLIPQCTKCQSFNHTKNYCGKQARCVRCGGKHESKVCDKPGEIDPKCCNCGERHPASYRGCIVAK